MVTPIGGTAASLPARQWAGMQYYVSKPPQEHSMLIEPLVGAARAAQVAGWHRDGEHDIARHPACPVCHPPQDTPTGTGHRDHEQERPL